MFDQKGKDKPVLEIMCKLEAVWSNEIVWTGTDIKFKVEFQLGMYSNLDGEMNTFLLLLLLLTVSL
jgi:hypothetical protein